MLSMLLGLAFLSRQFWGLVADRIGGLRTILAGSVCQIAAMVGFLAIQSEAGLFTVSALFGLGFSGIIPAYVLALRELFPASEASWRVPTLLLFSGSGMAFGGLVRSQDVNRHRTGTLDVFDLSVWYAAQNHRSAGPDRRRSEPASTAK
jgi:nitrate/nitrite transporter NarK